MPIFEDGVNVDDSSPAGPSIRTDTDAEYAEAAQKAAVVAGDRLLLEDSADGWAKKWALISALPSASGSALTVTTVSSGPTYAASTYNTLYKVTAAAVVEVDLPTAVGHTGETIDVMAVQGATYTITVDPNASETINGSAASITLTSDYANVTLVSDGTNWVIR
jgi:uncharacterized secreted protein with C-terminal beta-propeller domain